MNEQERVQNHSDMLFIWPVLFAAMAGGMAWGIRGQYGHETGAMMAGLLVSLTLITLLCRKANLLSTARCVALATVAMGLGGSMTYGQTVGLTHDAALVGNWDALQWGFLGLAIKGGVWIGFCGVFFGMGLGGVRYRWREMVLLMAALIGAYIGGLYLFHTPFDPENMQLPYLYFSDHWHWEPDTYGKPRYECWGGLAMALLTTIVYAGLIRGDKMARRIAFWGIVGGALGFPIGQGVQAYHAWNADWFRELDQMLVDSGRFEIFKHFNWWNMMETTFGAIMGASLGFGVWLNRKHIQLTNVDDGVYMPTWFEGSLLALHIPLLIGVEFFAFAPIDFVYDLGLGLVFIPIVCILGGRFWPYLIIYPITLLPIAGKTLRQLGYNEGTIGLPLGWAIYVIIPLLLFTAIALWNCYKPVDKPNGRLFASWSLLVTGWMIFLLNYAFFQFPWPWQEWTARTPNGIIFSVCIVCLSLVALTVGIREWLRQTPNEAPVQDEV